MAFSTKQSVLSSGGKSSNHRVSSVRDEILKNGKKIPDRYVRPVEERPSVSVSLAGAGEALQIPFIDINNFSDPMKRSQELLELFNACAHWGFFQLVNHGIAEKLMEDVKRVAKEFFTLPFSEKQKYAVRASGMQGYGQTFVVSDEQKLDWLDLLSLIMSPVDCKDYSVWPQHPSDFREVAENYFREINRVAQQLLELMGESLGLGKRELQSVFEKEGSEQVYVKMRMNLYPACEKPEIVNGLSPHADMTGITLLLQEDGIMGLQVWREEQKEWVGIKPFKNALLINMGNLMEVISNGIFRSAEHRVVANRLHDRLSVAFFYAPPLNSVIAPADSLQQREGFQALFRSFLHSDYIRYYFSQPPQGKDGFYRFVAADKPSAA